MAQTTAHGTASTEHQSSRNATPARSKQRTASSGALLDETRRVEESLAPGRGSVSFIAMRQPVLSRHPSAYATRRVRAFGESARLEVRPADHTRPAMITLVPDAAAHPLPQTFIEHAIDIARSIVRNSTDSGDDPTCGPTNGAGQGAGIETGLF
jgi:hypothetical protein